MYPEDPRARHEKRGMSAKEQILVILMAVGIAISVTGLAASFLYLVRM